MACLIVASLPPFAFAQQPAAAPSSGSSSPTQPQTGAQEQKAPDPPSSGKEIQDKQSASQDNTSGTSKDRLFYALPNFLTLENAGQVPPLTTKQKFIVQVQGSFDYVQIPWYAFLSGLSQAEDSEPGYGQGAEGYGKRFGATFADGTIENFMTGFVFPTLLRQDPRYFQSGKGSFMHRTFYAASRNLITRTDAGKNQFNYSEIVGGALSAAISTYAYHPKGQLVTTTTGTRFIPSDRTIPNTAKVWATQYGYDTLTLVIKEFWPDIRRKMSRKHRVVESAAINAPHP